MPKTPDEIKKAMAYCVEPYCPGEKCPYWDAESCAQDKTYDALALIQQLEAELRVTKANHQHTIDIAEKQKEQIQKLKSVIVKLNKERVPEWISVEEMLPERDKEVLCFFVYPDSTTVCQNVYYGNGHWLGEGSFVTHWMPLPEPPKEVEK